MSNHETPEVRRFEQAIRTRDRNQCRICNRNRAEADDLYIYEIVPGVDDLQMGNYVLLCDEHYEQASDTEM